MKQISLLFFTTIALTACNEKIYTKDELIKNEELTLSIIADCKSGKINQESLNCKNADEAKIIIGLEKATKNFKSLSD